MERSRNLWGFLSGEAPMTDLSLNPQPLIEIAGDRRVLMEHHLGILSYTEESICVRLPWGSATICGKNLRICRMTREQLVVSGSIRQVCLHRREEA